MVKDYIFIEGELFEIYVDNRNIIHRKKINVPRHIEENLPQDCLAAKYLTIPKDGWRLYKRVTLVTINKSYKYDYNLPEGFLWRVSIEDWEKALYGTLNAIVGQLREEGKLDKLLNHVLKHDWRIYTSWSGRVEATPKMKKYKPWQWLGDWLLFQAARQAKVPDGKYYTVRSKGLTLRETISLIRSGRAYQEYYK